MQASQLLTGAEFVLLAALWGASFLFMRLAVPEFGPVPMMALRVAIAALCLLPLLMLRKGFGELRTRFGSLMAVGTINSAIPFWLFAFATLYLNAGFTSILNATTPFWAAIISWLWLREKIGAVRVLGLAIGFAGVLMLVWDKATFKGDGPMWGILAALAATLLYGMGANFTRSKLAGIDSLTISTGAMIGATLVLAPFALLYWPAQPPSARAWLCVLVLGSFGTGFAYILYYRLIRKLGASGGVTVTFLIPAFGMLWGALFLDEAVTQNMIVGTALILAGTALTTGLIQLRRRIHTS